MGYDGRYVQCARPLQNGRWTIKLKIVWSAAAHKPTLIKSAVNGRFACIQPYVDHLDQVRATISRRKVAPLGTPAGCATRCKSARGGGADAVADAVADADHHRPLLSHHTFRLWCIRIIPDMTESEKDIFNPQKNIADRFNFFSSSFLIKIYIK